MIKPTFVRAMVLLYSVINRSFARRILVSNAGISAEDPTFSVPDKIFNDIIVTSVHIPERIMWMAVRAEYLFLACGSVLLASLCWIAVQLPSGLNPSKSSARTTAGKASEIRVAINVINASLPVTIGVPVSETANLTDVSQLSVEDANGSLLPLQTRVLARWNGIADDSNKPVKWLLADFKPVIAGNHFITRAVKSVDKTLSTAELESSIRVINSKLTVSFSKQGGALIGEFKIAGQEFLRAPVIAQMRLPRRVLINQIGSSLDTVKVTDTTLLRVGDEVRYEHVDSLKWDASAGSARLVTNDQSFASNRIYLINEGTSKQEEVVVTSAQPGDLRTEKPLRYSHPAGTIIRDLSIEQERSTIKTINGQSIQFVSRLKAGHSLGEKMIATRDDDTIAQAHVEKIRIEEANAFRVVIKQEGSFRAGNLKAPPRLNFSMRYYVYADQPFVRVRLRIMNNGAYGFGAYRSGPSPFAEHAILRSLSVLLPTFSPGNGTVRVLESGDARKRILQKQSGASLAAGTFEIAVPEFVENYPKALQGDKEGLRFDVLPDTGTDYIFDGARAKTADFYLGQNTITARALTNSPNATLDPAYIAQTGAVRPAFIERRNWTSVLKQDAQLSEAAMRVEKLFASAYAVEASESSGAVPAQSIFEYRQRGEQGEQFGWRNFGDLAWGDGYANVHYDLPFILLREYLRSSDARAFQLGSEMARYRADWGQFRADDYLNESWNLRGMAFYEKGDHGSFREPVPSHSWIEGMWLYWALTGDESVRESALEGSEAFARMNFNYNNSLDWNEPRWIGWPTLGLVAAYRYTGNQRYLDKARDNVKLMVQTENDFGRKGFYIGKGMNAIQAVQPWAWSYAQLGVIEYWRETGDKAVGDYLVRLADWLISKDSDNPPLKPGKTLADGSYLPTGMSYYWYPDKISEDRSVALAGLSLPILAVATRISKRDDLRDRTRQLFCDYAFYRDLAEGRPVTPSTRAVINFRSVLFAGSATKVYGQMGLTIADYLPELMDSVNASSTQVLSPAPRRDQAAVTEFSSSVTSATLTNVALNCPATASSQQIWPDVVGVPGAANDGQTEIAGKASAWHSASNTGKPEWWQVDLGKGWRIKMIEIAFRADRDQPITRRNFEVRGSNNPNFSNSALLAAQNEEAFPFKQTWRAEVTDNHSYRYVRVQKTKLDKDSQGQAYFNLNEVRLWAPTYPEITSANLPTDNSAISLTQIRPQKLVVGQSLIFKLALKNQSGQPLQISAYNLPENSNFNSASGDFWFTPDSTQAGTVYQISFRVLDAGQLDSFARMDVAVVIDGAPEVKLLSPKPGDRLIAGQRHLIKWSVPQFAQIVRSELWLSTDGGASYPLLLADLPGFANQYQWTIPRNFPVINRSSLRLMVRTFDTQNRVGIDYSALDLRVSLGSPQR